MLITLSLPQQLRSLFLLLVTTVLSVGIATSQTKVDYTQIKNLPFIDVRTIGVDCTFVNDSSAALNALTTVNDSLDGKFLMFPSGCHVRLASTWTIKNQSAFRIGGLASAGNNGGFGAKVPTLTWVGAPGGTMIDMEYVDGFNLQNMGVDGGGIAGIGINVDKTGGGGVVNTTDGIFDRLLVHAGEQGGSNSTWVGMKFSAVSGSNVEDMRITNSTFYCGNLPTSGVAAIQIASSFNAKGYTIDHNFIHNCTNGVRQDQGHATIQFNEVGNNSVDFAINYYTDPERVSYNLSESATAGAQFLVLGVVNHVVEVTGNNIPVNNSCAITFTNGGTISSPNGNSFYNGFGGGVGGAKFCNGASAVSIPTVVGGLADFNVAPTDLASFLSFFSSHKPTFDSAGITNAPHRILMSNGTTWLESGIGYNNGDYIANYAVNLQVQPALPCSLNTICRDNGSHETTGISEITTAFCSLTGTGGPTIHYFYVSALDAGGRETLLMPLNGARCSGTVTYDASNFETISWIAVPGATSYNVYAANPNNPGNAVALIGNGIVGTSLQFNGPYPTSFPFTSSIHGLNQTISHIFRGRELDLQFSMALNGFSDRGVTKTWGISSTGVPMFSGGSANHAVCWKADGKTLGFCSSQPDATGGCACN
jgi:hypothetical protein